MSKILDPEQIRLEEIQQKIDETNDINDSIDNTINRGNSPLQPEIMHKENKVNIQDLINGYIEPETKSRQKLKKILIICIVILLVLVIFLFIKVFYMDSLIADCVSLVNKNNDSVSKFIQSVDDRILNVETDIKALKSRFFV